MSVPAHRCGGRICRLRGAAEKTEWANALSLKTRASCRWIIWCRVIVTFTTMSLHLHVPGTNRFNEHVLSEDVREVNKRESWKDGQCAGPGELHLPRWGVWTSSCRWPKALRVTSKLPLHCRKIPTATVWSMAWRRYLEKPGRAVWRQPQQPRSKT